ncbi:MAG: dipeptidase [Candidatus Thorarchaeota archaeon]
MINYDEFVVLAHTDYLIDIAERRSWGEKQVLENRHLSTLKAGGVDIICDHVGGRTRMFSTFPLKKMLDSADSMERSLHSLDCMWEEAKESSEKLAIIQHIKDIESLKAQDKLGIVLCLQGGSPIKEDLALLRTFYRLGIRCMHLTSNVRNKISDSCADRNAGGLTHFGVEVVQEMNRIGMVIDLAQMSHRGCLDVLEITDQPVIVSNSNARALCDHPRNLHDNVIEQVGKAGGVIGVHCLPSFLKTEGKVTVDDMVKHIRYIVDLIGVEYVGLGPDLLEDWPKEKHDTIWGVQQLDGKPVEFEYPDGFSSISDIPNLRKKLLDNGFSNEDVGKILGGNLLRVFRDVWK